MSEAAASGSQNGVTIGVRMSTAARFDIRVESLDQTILSVKHVIATKEESGKCPVERQRLIYKGRILSDDSRTLRDYGLVEGSSPATLHLVKGSAAPSNTPSISTPTPAPTVTTTATPNPFGGAPGTGGGNNGMGNMMQQMMQMQQQQGGGGGPPDMAQMQQQLMQNPEMMQEMMNSPIMQSMMDNPQLMQNIMQNNPQMQQLLQQNPELRHVLEDPEMMRRSMQMMRDPSLQQQMMRNQDLAMGQIENMPGGFNALRRMYQDVQEPMMDAMIQPETNSSNTTNNSPASRGGSMPNPWGSPTPTTNTPSATQSNPFTGAGTGGGGSLGNNNMMPPNPWGGAGVPDMNNPFGASGGAPTQANLNQTIEMLENPMVANMMNQMFADPQAMQSMMDSNPMLRQMRDSNPQMAQMLSNPEAMRAMMNPQNLRAMSQLQGAMQQMGGANGAPGMIPPMMPPNPAGNTSAPPAGGLDFSSVLNQFQSTNIGMSGTGGATRAPAGFGAVPMALPPPEQRFRHQLQSLRDMGFDDEAENIRALTMNHGNVNRAIETLFEGPPAAPAPTPAAAPAPAPTDSSNSNDGSPDDSPPADKKND